MFFFALLSCEYYLAFLDVCMCVYVIICDSFHVNQLLHLHNGDPATGWRMSDGGIIGTPSEFPASAKRCKIRVSCGQKV